MKKSWFSKITACILMAGMIMTGISIPSYAEEKGAAGGEDVIILPMQLVDYRADNLLFQYIFDEPGSKMALTNTEIEGPTGGKVEERPGNSGGDSAFFTTGLVKNRLTKEGYPEYTEEAVTYVANKVLTILEQELDDSADNVYPFYTQLRNQIMGEQVYHYSSGLFDWHDWTIAPIEEGSGSEEKSRWAMAGNDLTYTYVSGTPESLRSNVFVSLGTDVEYTLSCWTQGNGDIVIWGYQNADGIGGETLIKNESLAALRNSEDSFQFKITDPSIKSFRISVQPAAILPGDEQEYSVKLGNNMKLSYMVSQDSSETTEDKEDETNSSDTSEPIISKNPNKAAGTALETDIMDPEGEDVQESLATDVSDSGKTDLPDSDSTRTDITGPNPADAGTGNLKEPEMSHSADAGAGNLTEPDGEDPADADAENSVDPADTSVQDSLGENGTDPAGMGMKDSLETDDLDSSDPAVFFSLETRAAEETSGVVFDATIGYGDKTGWSYLFDSNGDGASDENDYFTKTWKDTENLTETWITPPEDSKNIESSAGGDLYKSLDGLTAEKEYCLKMWYKGGPFKYTVETLNEAGEVIQTAASGTLRKHDDWFGTAEGLVGGEEVVALGTIDAGKVKITFTSTANDPVELGGDCVLEEIVTQSSYRLGSYEESVNKTFQSETDITTCFDYAYYMMNHYFDSKNVLGRPYNFYNKLVLTPDADGNGYVFYANFDGNHGFDPADSDKQWLPITYDLATGTIRNNPDQSAYTEKGFYPLSRRNAINSDGELLVDTDGAWQEVANGLVGDGTTENYHYAMKSSGKFVYEEGLFFDFTGDDDVYLFIDGELALDIGGAHYAVNGRIDVDTIAKTKRWEMGSVHKFDFFYLERHSDYANIRVNSNIRLLYDSATIKKSAYIYGTEQLIPSGSTVVPGTKVEYAFTVKNVGTLPLHNLHIKDEMLGVDISKDSCRINNKEITNTDELKLRVRVKWYSSSDTNEDAIWNVSNLAELQGLLSAIDSGLQPAGGYIAGAEITIYGFEYNVPTVESPLEYDKALENGINNVVELQYDVYEDGNEGDETYLITRDAGKATHIMNVAVGDEYYAWANGEEIELNGLAENTIIFKDDYNNITWADKKDQLAVIVKAGNAKSQVRYEAVEGKVYYTPENGISGNWAVDDSVSVSLTGTISVIAMGDDGTRVTEDHTVDIELPVTVHLYDVKENIYVFDYGLQSDLADTSHGNGMFQNDLLYNANAATNAELTDMDTTALTQGRITLPQKRTLVQYVSESGLSSGARLEAGGVLFKPVKFMDKVESATYTATVYKGDKKPDSITAANGAVMEGRIQLMPASVVYYEDNFASGTDNTDSKSGIIYTGNVQENGIDVTITQSNSLEGVYGFDEAYENFNKDSGNGSTSMTSAGYNTQAAFTFKGTGFDIVGRTTSQKAVLMYSVLQKTSAEGEAEKYKAVKNGVVDTYYANGDLYQIPVINVKDLPYGEYKAVIMVIALGENKDATFYFDGVRIYDPLGKGGDDAYNEEEKGATTANISEMLLGNCDISEIAGENAEGSFINPSDVEGSSAALMDLSDLEEGKIYFGGSTYTEDQFTETPTYVASLVDYLKKGPNNEVYLGDQHGIGFVIPNVASPVSGDVQVEAKVVDVNGTGDTEVEPLVLQMVTGTAGSFELTEVAEVKSRTAMYYKIDLTKAIRLGNNSYLVILSGTENNHGDSDATCCISLSNLKYKEGYTVINPIANNAAGSIITKHDVPEDTYAVEITGVKGKNAIQRGKAATLEFTIQSTDKPDMAGIKVTIDGEEASVSMSKQPYSAGTNTWKCEAKVRMPKAKGTYNFTCTAYRIDGKGNDENSALSYSTNIQVK